LSGLRKKTYFTRVAAIACVLFALGSAEGLVLCCGDDGHVALETSVTGTCCHSGLSMGSQKASHSVLSLDDHCSKSPCGICVDIPLSAGQKAVYSAQDRNKRPAATANILYTTGAEYSSAAWTTNFDRSLATTSSSFGSVTALLSCTILLI